MIRAMDRRLPLKIHRQPGGFSIEFADGSPRLMVYGSWPPETARAGNVRTTDEAMELARDVARALTKLWGE